MRGACAWLYLLALASGLEGQSPAQPVLQLEQPSGTEQPLPCLLPGELAAPAIGQGLQHFIDAKLLVGFPTGVRLQAALDRGPNRTWVAEAFAGSELANAIVGGGGRVFFAPAAGRRHDALLLGPGLNFYYLVGDRSSGEGLWFATRRNGYFLVPDVEIAWLHDFGSHFGWEIGLDVGLGLGVWQAYEDEPRRIGPVPMLSAFTGFKF